MAGSTLTWPRCPMMQGAFPGRLWDAAWEVTSVWGHASSMEKSSPGLGASQHPPEKPSHGTWTPSLAQQQGLSGVRGRGWVSSGHLLLLKAQGPAAPSSALPPFNVIPPPLSLLPKMYLQGMPRALYPSPVSSGHLLLFSAPTRTGTT